MSKPILVTRLPIKVDYKYMEHVRDHFKEIVPDYNHILFRDSSVDRVEFEVFNVQDYPVIDFETLKAKIESLNEPDKTIN